jgi:hypothetical protein
VKETAQEVNLKQIQLILSKNFAFKTAAIINMEASGMPI